MARLKKQAHLLRRHLRHALRKRVRGKGWSWVRVAVAKGARGWPEKGKCFAELTDDRELLRLFARYERQTMRPIRATVHPDFGRIRRAIRSSASDPLEELYETLESVASEDERGIFTATGSFRTDFIHTAREWTKSDGFGLRELHRALSVEGSVWRSGHPHSTATLPVLAFTCDETAAAELTEKIALRIFTDFISRPKQSRPQVRHIVAASRFHAKMSLAEASQAEWIRKERARLKREDVARSKRDTSRLERLSQRLPRPVPADL